MAGETTKAASLGAVRKVANAGLQAYTWALNYLATDVQLADVMEAGYLPAGVTVIGFLYCPHDSDSSTGTVQKISVGSTDVATGLTGGQTGTKSFVPITPLTTTAKTLVSITTTTAASGTPAAGTTYLTALYHAA